MILTGVYYSNCNFYVGDSNSAICSKANKPPLLPQLCILVLVCLTTKKEVVKINFLPLNTFVIMEFLFR